jgi:flavin reductase (DIM6/NTAB) family NADH-FMN oxidoreductase RutF
VQPARVAECPLAIECKLYDIVAHGDGPLSANYVIGEVVYFHIAQSLMPDGVFNPRLVDYIARMGGDWYARGNAPAMFEMPRPPKVDKHPQVG